MANHLQALSDAIFSGLQFLTLQQEKDGSFLHLSTPQENTTNDALRIISPFTTSLILLGLEPFSEKKKIAVLRKKAIQFLLAQASTYWSFNYWPRNSQEAKENPYPDDLDDTFCALSAIFQFCSNEIDGGVLAHVVKLLTATEIKVGGPYKTWLVDTSVDAIWQDVDLAVNSNIAYFFHLQSVTIPPLQQFIEENVKNKTFTSPYYPSIYPIIYFISRFYSGQFKENMIQVLLSKRNEQGNWGTALNTALAISSLFNLKADFDEIEKGIAYIISQQKNGGWEAGSFFIDSPLQNKKRYAGAEALTTAYCLNALAVYQQQIIKKKEIAPQIDNNFYHKLQKQIIKIVEENFDCLSIETRNIFFTIFQKLLSHDTQQQITLLPFYFLKSLRKPLQEKINDDLVTNLCVATVLGWIAYTIYDNFLDDEGDPKTLPIATIALRKLTIIFTTLMQCNDIHMFVDTVLNDLDDANAWEINYCRVLVNDSVLQIDKYVLPHYDDYTILARKSFGHALGPLAIIIALGYEKDDEEFEKVRLFFKHYLIARQLNDDAHDWEKDLAKGHINPVVALLLENWKKKSLKISKNISLSTLIPQLQQQFWYETIVDVCHLIQEHIQHARRQLESCAIIDNKDILLSFLDPIQRSIEKALKERNQAIQFLQTYEGV